MDEGYPAYGESEDQQMERAMAMSLSESQTLPGQESGVTGQGQTAFGPATRDHYDSSKWSVTLAGTQTQEIILNPEPFDRKRQLGTPAFFKPSEENYKLAALIKILHEIPMAREALLNRSQLLSDYSYNPEWWDGSPIKVLKVVNIDQGYQSTHGRELINETQRLMAFLDKTDRAYGSIDALAGSLGWTTSPDDKLAKFLTLWEEATAETNAEQPLTHIFRSRGLKRDLKDAEFGQDQTFHALSVQVGQDLADKGMSLYDAIDDMMWTDSNHDTEVFLAEIGDVLTLDVSNPNTEATGLGVDVPATWYLDRWLESSTKKAREALDRKASIYARLEHIGLQQEQLLKYRPNSGTSMDASKLLESATTYLESTLSYHEGNDGQAQACQNISQLFDELRTMTDRVANKLRSFEKTKHEARQQLSEALKFYTQPTDDPETNPTHKYTLRGVATGPQTMYVHSQTRLETDYDILSSEARDWQWWKLEFIAQDSKPVNATRISEESVLEAARTSSRSTLLVYASARAVDLKPSSLPPQLENFVRHDNLSFSAELDQAAPLAQASPSPWQRKAANDSESDDDLITHLPQTPPAERDLIENDLFGPNPNESKQENFRPRSRTQSRTTNAYSHKIDSVAGRQSPGHQVLPSPQTIGQSLDQEDEGDREMEERSSPNRGNSLAHQISRKPPPYKLASYVPEIDMSDDESDGRDRATGGTWQAGETYQGRGSREDLGEWG